MGMRLSVAAMTSTPRGQLIPLALRWPRPSTLILTGFAMLALAIIERNFDLSGAILMATYWYIVSDELLPEPQLEFPDEHELRSAHPKNHHADLSPGI